MALDTVAGLVELIRQCRLLEPAQEVELLGHLVSRFREPRALARELVGRGWLTPYQANHLFQGGVRDLLLGQYVLLEPLGAGGMGEVFKARHSRLGQTVALKLIRRERVANPEAVRRFRREIRAAAQLSHPNIVRAFDADEVGGTHFFTMEYVRGTDLGRLVKQAGPLRPDVACSYARQAALALQHAYERGLVHRDIKPHNLLVSGQGVLKVLDFGLARVSEPSADASATALTREGVVMGTADFLAPEQALDSRLVDTRADLYSLGCTLYYLLAGRVPFPGGSLTEKLLKHRLQEPPRVEELRPEVPPEVGAVVRRLMAKEPKDRYQTPAQMVGALEAGVPAPVAGGAEPGTSSTQLRLSVEANREATALAADSSPGTAPPSAETFGPSRGDAGPRRRLPWPAGVALAGSAVLLGGLALAAFLLLRPAQAPATRAGHAPATAATPAPGATRREDITITYDPRGLYRVRAPAYQATVEGDGCLTHLRVGGVEFFKPGVDISRGSYFYHTQDMTALALPKIERTAGTGLMALGSKASIRYEFGRDSMTWTVANTSDAEEHFHIIFDPAVTAVRDGEGTWARLPAERDWPTTTWFAGRSKLTVRGGTSIWGPWMGPYEVWQKTLAPRETGLVKLEAGEASEQEAGQAAALSRP
jgi:serine/threonine protein kinase